MNKSFFALKTSVLLSVGLSAMLLAACSGHSPQELSQVDQAVRNGQLVQPKTSGQEHSWADYAVEIRTDDKFSCSGSLIHPKVAITAAHCFDGVNLNSLDVVVNFGTESTEPVHSIRARQVIIHEDYKIPANKEQDDIALIVLSSDAPAWMKIVNVSNSLYHPGDYGDLVGLGYGALHGKYNSADTADGKLRKTNLQLNLDDVIAKRYFFYQEQTGMCFGDSGGPFILMNGDIPYLAGIMSLNRPKMTDALMEQLESLGGDVNRFQALNPELDWCAHVGAMVNVQHYDFWVKTKMTELGFPLKDPRDRD